MQAAASGLLESCTSCCLVGLRGRTKLRCTTIVCLHDWSLAIENGQLLLWLPIFHSGNSFFPFAS